MPLLAEYNGSNMVDMLTYSNEITNDLFGVGFIVIFWFIMFAVFSYGRDGDEKAIAGSSLLTTIIAWSFAGLNIINPVFAIGTTAVLVGSLIILYWGGG